MTPYKKHVFVCTYGKTCPTRGSEEVLKVLREEVKNLPSGHSIRINKSGCLDHCEHGPMIVVYPEGIWYSGVTPKQCLEIAQSHLAKDQ